MSLFIFHYIYTYFRLSILIDDNECKFFFTYVTLLSKDAFQLYLLLIGYWRHDAISELPSCLYE